MLKRMRQGLVAGIVVTMVTLPSLSFANEMPREKAPHGKAQIEKPMEGRADFFRDKMTDVIMLNAPDLLADFELFWSEHEVIHEALKQEKERLRETEREAVRAKADQIRASLTAGDITREEAKTQLEALRNEERTLREALRTEMEALQGTYEVSKEDRDALHKALETALESDDAEAIALALNNILLSHQKHLAFDQAKLELLKTK